MTVILSAIDHGLINEAEFRDVEARVGAAPDPVAVKAAVVEHYARRLEREEAALARQVRYRPAYATAPTTSELSQVALISRVRQMLHAINLIVT